MTRIVLAYSGGSGSSLAIRWLAFMAKAQERVSGEVRLRLSKGQCHVVASAAAGVTVTSGTERVETTAVGEE